CCHLVRTVQPTTMPLLRPRNDRHELGRGYDRFFFQAEDGIRDSSVTGVQTCALPISVGKAIIGKKKGETVEVTAPRGKMKFKIRSEERRVGKEWRSRWSTWR